ncbi:MAG: 16S rRNA (adenine(1518)-N(6)/adenine(1519)-N(6))-dimethyltransferase RsmA [bacterium]|nr:16S rRNA (adenine(1518)-N(6)/adenine(1519)-N(6))-dimethyltransferase RsmA [bacterium]
MEKHNFKKKFGQNFISDINLIERIINSVEINNNDLIIEIGPGAGSLTKELVKKCKVLAYEIDKELEKKLDNINKEKLNIIWDDFLKRNIKEDISKYKYKKIHLIANIPYYITTPIIEKIIDSKVNFENILIMVQKEVANRFSSTPGNKEYGQITVFLNYYFDIKKLFDVSKNYFYPKPNVDSSILLLRPKKNVKKIKDMDKFLKFIKDCFKFKRKTLKNNLKEYNIEKINKILNKYSLDISVRAEQIPLDIFIDISNNI